MEEAEATAICKIKHGGGSSAESYRKALKSLSVYSVQPLGAGQRTTTGAL